MIEGITILSQNDILTNKYNLIVCFIVIAIGVFVTVLSGQGDGSVLKAFGLLCGIAIVIVFFILALQMKPTGKYEYKVLISEEVKLGDFEKKYEIINKDGQIYTIQEKETEDKK
jgi:hypothetical protein